MALLFNILHVRRRILNAVIVTGCLQFSTVDREQLFLLNVYIEGHIVVKNDSKIPLSAAGGICPETIFLRILGLSTIISVFVWIGTKSGK